MIVGIDLGTTHSLIAIFEQEGPKLIPNSKGSFLTPSVASLDEYGKYPVDHALSKNQTGITRALFSPGASYSINPETTEALLQLRDKY